MLFKRIPIWLVVYFFLVVGVSTLLLQLPIRLSHFQLKVVPQLWLLTMSLSILVLFAIWTKRSSAKRGWIAVCLLGFFLTIYLVLIYRNTFFGFNGYFSDSEFMLASITKYATFWKLVDFNYHGLSAFYPPLYFYVEGKIAWLLHIEPYKISRYAMFAAAAIFPLVVYRIWKPILGLDAAVLFTYLALLLFPLELFWKPYEYLTMVVILPWWYLLIEKQSSANSWKKTLWVGFLGALIFLTYYYWFFLLFLYLMGKGIWILGKWRSFRYLWEEMRYPFQVLLIVGLFSSVFWFPLLLDFIQYGLEPLQNRYFQSEMLKIPAISLDHPDKVLFAIGFIVLFWKAAEKGFARWIFALVIGCYVWQLLGFIGILTAKPNLHFKMFQMLEFLLIVGVAIGFSYLLKWEKVQSRISYLVAGALFLSFVTFGQDVIAYQETPFIKRALQSKVPAEVAILKKVDPHLEERVILTEKSELAAFIPISQFHTHHFAFTHHSAQRQERLQFLRELQSFSNPNFVAWMLRHNRFDQVDYLSLKDGRILLLEDDFPTKLQVSEVRFVPDVLTSPAFSLLDAKTELYRVGILPDQVYQGFSAEEKRFAEKYQK